MLKKKFGLIALILCIVLTIGYFAINTGAVSTVLLAIQGAITDGNLVKFSGTNGIGVDTGLSATNVVKCKFNATSAPTENNDVSEGYTVGSRWLDITNLKSYVCLDNTDGAAVWIENVVEGDMNKATYDVDEDGDIDVAAGGTEKSVWTQYAIPYLSDTTTFGEIPIGTAEYVLTVNATATGYDFTLFDLTLYYLKTEIDTLGKVEAIYVKDIIDSDELDALKFTDLNDTPTNYTDQAGKYPKVNVGETALEFGTIDLTLYYLKTEMDSFSKLQAIISDKTLINEEDAITLDNDLNMGTHKIIGVVDPVNPQEVATKAYADTKVATEVDPSVDSDAKIKAILEDEVTKSGDFTAGRMAIINNASGIIEQGTNTDTEVADAVTKKHSQNTDTQFDFYNALAEDHTWSGQKDTQLVGESVVFGDLLYFNWTDKEWKKAKADAYATCPAERIALEDKNDGEDCLMLVKGYIRDESAFDFGASRIYLNDDTAGTCDDTAPEESGDQIQIVGTAIHADILFFNPSVDVGEI